MSEVARNTTEIEAPLDAAWSVVADGWRYSDWVVGSRQVRDVDRAWPAPGARIHHTVGVGRLSFDDDTEVVEADHPHRLVLEARLRPFATARVELQFEERDGAIAAVIDEQLVDGPLARLPRLLSDPLLKGRNIETLRRLRSLVERRRAVSDRDGRGSRPSRDDLPKLGAR